MALHLDDTNTPQFIDILLYKAASQLVYVSLYIIGNHQKVKCVCSRMHQPLRFTAIAQQQ